MELNTKIHCSKPSARAKSGTTTCTFTVKECGHDYLYKKVCDENNRPYGPPTVFTVISNRGKEWTLTRHGNTVKVFSHKKHQYKDTRMGSFKRIDCQFWTIENIEK